MLKKVLVCPLEWGLGHATHCVPVIKALMASGVEVIIGADGSALEFLKKEFPGFRFIRFPGTPVRYPQNGSMFLKLLFRLPHLMRGVKNEHRFLNYLIDKEGIDAVISDNRYGLWSKKVYSVFITHQVMVKIPGLFRFLEKHVSWLICSYIRRYHECWIPDFEGTPNLSGDLSHRFPVPPNCYFVGPLSRFHFIPSGKANPLKHTIELLVLISGPEPQRTFFEQIMCAQLQDSDIKTLIIKGMPGTEEVTRISANVTAYSHMKTNELEDYLRQAQLVITRPGYSTLMDLAILGKKAILVPTPGQTEQEYLAQLHSENKRLFTVNQKYLELRNAIESSSLYLGFEPTPASPELGKRIQALVLRLKNSY